MLKIEDYWKIFETNKQWQGTWNSNNSYKINDHVYDDNNIEYVCLSPCINIPVTNETYWALSTSTNGNNQNLPSITESLAKSEKANAKFLFENRLDQNVFATDDYKRIRKFLIDWYASHKTLTTIQKKYPDPYSMSGDILDEVFRSFGYNFSTNIVTKGSIINHNKINLLLDLVNLYRIKGTPDSILGSLKYYGFNDIDLIEFFLKKETENKLVFESTIVASNGNTGTTLLKKYTEFDTMISGDPHWFMSEQDILTYIDSTSNLIALPSKSPYFSLRITYSSDEISSLISYLKRVAFDQYYSWRDTGVKPEVNANLSLTGTQCTFLELYVSTIYILYSFYKTTAGYDPQSHFTIYDATSNVSTQAISDYEYFSKYDLSDQNFFTSAQGNTIGNNTIVVNEIIPDNTPSSGTILIYFPDSLVSNDTNILYYSSWSESTFILSSYNPFLFYDITPSTVISVKCTPVETKDIRISQFRELFTKPKIEDFLIDKDTCGIILNERNPSLKSELDTILDITPVISLISPFLKDMDDWVRFNIPESFPKLSYHMYGSDTILKDVGDVINFFKPFRSRLRSIELINAFTNRLTESAIIEDYNTDKIIEHCPTYITLDDSTCLITLKDIVADKLTCTSTAPGYGKWIQLNIPEGYLIGSSDLSQWGSDNNQSRYYIRLYDSYGHILSGWIATDPNNINKIYSYNLKNNSDPLATIEWTGDTSTFVADDTNGHYVIYLIMSESYLYYGDPYQEPLIGNVGSVGDLILYSTGGFTNFDAYGSKYDCTFMNDIVQIQVNELGDEILEDKFSS